MIDHCPVCGSANLTEPDERFALTLRDTPTSISADSALDVQLVICTDCGFTAMFTCQFIQDAKE